MANSSEPTGAPSDEEIDPADEAPGRSNADATTPTVGNADDDTDGDTDDTDGQALGDDSADEATTRSALTDLPVALTVGGCALIAIGVFTTWSSGDGITLNGTQGSQNGWLALLYAALALSVIPSLRRRSAPGIATVLLASVVTIMVVVLNQTVPGFDRGFGYWLTLAGGATLAAACSAAIARRSSENRPLRSGRPALVGGLLVGLAAFFFVVLSQVFAIREDVSWPPPPDAVTADEAALAAAAFAARDPQPGDVGLDYAWSTADTIEPWAEGTEFYPRIFADVEAAESSVHILMFGWKPGEIGDALTDVLVDRLADGVEVRIVVDGIGSRPVGASKEMYDRLLDAGAEIVVNDTTPIDRDGRLPGRYVDWRQDEVGRADHRKLYVIDGEIAWTGGAGIEDHFADGQFYDVMVRVTGDIVRQSQTVFFNAFVSHDAPLPDRLDRYFPEPDARGDTPAAIVQVVPGGFVSATQVTREMIDGATERLDIMNPYFTDRDIIERVLAAADRGVDVRIVLSEESNNGLAAAATRHRYGDLITAGVEIWEYPGAVVHAKIIVADDRVQFGTLNLDAWALYRNFEFAIVADSADTAEALEQRVFEPSIGRSRAATAPSGFGRLGSWLADKITYFL